MRKFLIAVALVVLWFWAGPFTWIDPAPAAVLFPAVIVFLTVAIDGWFEDRATSRP